MGLGGLAEKLTIRPAEQSYSCLSFIQSCTPSYDLKVKVCREEKLMIRYETRESSKQYYETYSFTGSDVTTPDGPWTRLRSNGKPIQVDASTVYWKFSTMADYQPMKMSREYSPCTGGPCPDCCGTLIGYTATFECR